MKLKRLDQGEDEVWQGIIFKVRGDSAWSLSDRLRCGGCFGSLGRAMELRIGYRVSVNPSYNYHGFGVRLFRNLSQRENKRSRT
jgi:hypothetical protein